MPLGSNQSRFNPRGCVHMNRLLCFGMTSHIPRTKRNVVFLDYDHTGYDMVIKRVKQLQHAFKLGVGHIARTGPNRYHVVFLDKLPLDVWKKVGEESMCHDGYLFHLNGQEYAILRLVKKVDNPAPKWLATVPSKGVWKQSVVHGMLLQKFWGLPTRHLGITRPDWNTCVETVYYYTDNLRPKPHLKRVRGKTGT